MRGTAPGGTRLARRYVVVAALSVLAVLVGGVGPWVYGTFVDTSAQDRIEADPPPRLFPDRVVAPIGRRIAEQSRPATRLMTGWWSQHDATPHDAQFVRWLERTFPGPPDARSRSAELRMVQALARDRTAEGTTASTWLETYGKKDLWKLYAHDQAEMVPGPVGEARKAALKDLLSMSKDVADALGTKYQQSAPYVLDPSLRRDHTVSPGQVCPCSYPSRHAAAGAAARTFLGHFAPHRTEDYRWTEQEIAYSRIYMAGHVPSDITAGALLGDMVGEYFLVTRGHASPSAVTLALAPDR